MLTENVEVQERLLEQLTAEVEAGLCGVNIDFEYVLPEIKFSMLRLSGK